MPYTDSAPQPVAPDALGRMLEPVQEWKAEAARPADIIRAAA